MKNRTERLRSLMAQHDLTAAQVGEILGRKPGTVRIWTCKNPGREIPAHTLELLEAKLKNNNKKSVKK